MQWKPNLISIQNSNSNSNFFFNCLKSQLSDPFGCCKKVVEARFASEVAFLNSTPHENLPPLENSKKKVGLTKRDKGKNRNNFRKRFPRGYLSHRSGCEFWFDLRLSLLAPKMTYFPHILQKWSTWLYILQNLQYLRQ